MGMQTVAQLRRSLGLGAPRNADSLYKAVQRGPRKFHPLKIPRTLQVSLPRPEQDHLKSWLCATCHSYLAHRCPACLCRLF